MMAVLALAVVLAPVDPPSAQGATPANLRDYALSSCLIAQTVSSDLREEGHRLSNIVIYRAGIDPFVWRPLTRAVAVSLERHGMMQVHVDAPVVEATWAAPLASCLRAIDDPAVRSVMDRLRRGAR